MSVILKTPLVAAASPVSRTPLEQIGDFSGDPNFMASLARGLTVINAFQERKRQLTIAQISHRTGISRASVRRCLYTLMRLNYVNTDGRTWYLLPKVLTLGHAYLSSTPLAATAQPWLDRLSESLHEACNLATLEGDEILYVARAAVPERLISVDLNVGSRLPAYCTSMGRVLLAALDQSELRHYLDRAQFQIKTSRTLQTHEALTECLEQVRERGWCIVDQELEKGLRSVAVPVFGPGERVIAALNVSAHAGRVSVLDLERRYLPAMQSIARELSAQLGAPTA